MSAARPMSTSCLRNLKDHEFPVHGTEIVSIFLGTDLDGKGRVLCAQPNVAGRHQVQPCAEADAVDGGDDRLLAVLNRGDGPLQSVHVLFAGRSGQYGAPTFGAGPWWRDERERESLSGHRQAVSHPSSARSSFGLQRPGLTLLISSAVRAGSLAWCVREPALSSRGFRIRMSRSVSNLRGLAARSARSCGTHACKSRPAVKPFCTLEASTTARTAGSRDACSKWCRNSVDSSSEYAFTGGRFSDSSSTCSCGKEHSIRRPE